MLEKSVLPAGAQSAISCEIASELTIGPLASPSTRRAASKEWPSGVEWYQVVQPTSWPTSSISSNCAAVV